jgi:hypothetical protein
MGYSSAMENNWGCGLKHSEMRVFRAVLNCLSEDEKKSMRTSVTEVETVILTDRLLLPSDNFKKIYPYMVGDSLWE